MDTEERRRYFRIEDDVIFDWRLLNADEKQKHIQQIHINFMDHPDPTRYYLMLESDLLSVIQSIKVHNPDAAKALELMNRKLNIVARGGPVGISQSSLFEKASQTVNISACGMAFYTTDAIALNAALLIELVLLPEKNYIQCVGEVISCEHVRENNLYQVNVDFDVMREPDREFLIQHIVQREVEKLQQKRKSEGK